MIKLQVTLDEAEADALAKLAYSELRDPRDQIRLIVRRELEKLGLLSIDTSQITFKDVKEK